ncbi:MAG TPA: PAS domain S-box protein [Hanamia sp.]
MNNYLTPQPGSITFSTKEARLTNCRSKESRPLTASEIYDAIFRSAFHAMFYANKEGNILRFNQRCCRLFEYTTIEMWNIKSTQILEIHEQAFIDFIDKRSDKGIAIAEITGIRKSGKKFPCRISSVIYNSDSGHQRILNTVVDISDDLSARWNIGE